MRRLFVRAWLGLVPVGLGLAALWAAPAFATVTYGPTPDGAGNYFICNYWERVLSTPAEVACSYGVPTTGDKPVSFAVQFAAGSITFDQSVTYPAPGLVVATQRGAVDANSPQAGSAMWASGSYSGTVLMAGYVSSGGANVVPPSEQFDSGRTGVPPSYTAETVAPGLLGNEAATGQTQLLRWATDGVTVVFAVLLLALGAGLFVGIMQRWVWPATDGGDGGYPTVRGNFGGPLSEDWDDEESDDEHDDGDGVMVGELTNATDDVSDDEGEETDEGNLGGGIGLGDVESCVSCGAELEFGWDFDYCPECGGV